MARIATRALTSILRLDELAPFCMIANVDVDVAYAN